MTKIIVEIEFEGPYDNDRDNKAWLCAENIQLLINRNSAANAKVREIYDSWRKH